LLEERIFSAVHPGKSLATFGKLCGPASDVAAALNQLIGKRKSGLVFVPDEVSRSANRISFIGFSTRSWPNLR